MLDIKLYVKVLPIIQLSNFDTMDVIEVLKTVMHYGIVSGIEQRKVSWEI